MLFTEHSDALALLCELPLNFQHVLPGQSGASMRALVSFKTSLCYGRVSPYNTWHYSYFIILFKDLETWAVFEVARRWSKAMQSSVQPHFQPRKE